MKYPPATDATPEALARALGRSRPSAGSPAEAPAENRPPAQRSSGAIPEEPEISLSELREQALTMMDEIGLKPETVREFDRRIRSGDRPPFGLEE